MNSISTKPENVVKTSFPPISNHETEILILGTLPGEKSLQLNEYYAHPQNKFWKIIAAITNNQFPISYSEKRSLLLSNSIGVWDVVHQAKRIGSLDSNILDEIPNGINEFIENHKKLKTVGFNGAKAEKLFDKHFKRQENIRYVALPSSSPANARISFEEICERWREILS
jgi:hypoxanthine-DNA glycosylase